MARGFLGGAALGLVVAVGGSVGLSLITGGPVMRGGKPDASAVDVPAGSEFNGARDDQQASLPASEPVAAPAGAPRVTAPEPDTLASLENADTTPGEQPKPGGVEQAPSAPAGDTATAPQVTSTPGDTRVQPGTQQAAPQAPKVEPGLSISTEPAQPQAPLVDIGDSAFADPADPVPAATDAPDPDVTSEPAPEPEVVGAPAPNVQVEAPVEPQAPATGEEDSPAAPEVTEAPKVDPTPDVATPAAAAPEPVETVSVDPTPAEPSHDRPVIKVEPETEPVPESVATPGEQDVNPTPPNQTPAPQVATADPTPAPEPNDPVVPVQPEAEAEPGPPSAAASEPQGEQAAAIRIGKPATNLLTRDNGIKSNRLPTLGAASGENGGEAGGGSAAVGGGSGASAMPPIKRFAVEFQAPEDMPKMAVVLIDEGKGPVGVEALSTFPYPLTFAVDASREDAEEVMSGYRAAGFEVLAMVALEKGSKPSDVEVAMPVLLGRVPEAVGVMEAPGNGIQFDRKVSDQVARILADTGHGLLLFPKGLNTAQKLAAKNGVPSAAVFRDIDGKGQKAGAIRRFLNYGALNAGNEGGVVMVARLRPDTVTALLLWGLEDRARQIVLTPVSQLLSVQP